MRVCSWQWQCPLFMSVILSQVAGDSGLLLSACDPRIPSLTISFPFQRVVSISGSLSMDLDKPYYGDAQKKRPFIFEPPPKGLGSGASSSYHH